MSFWGRLRSFDIYTKVHEDMRVKTTSGATISVVAICFILFLFFSELGAYLRTETVDHLYVDTSRGEKLRINFDVSFLRAPCSVMSVDAMDVSGAHQLDISHHIVKVGLDESGLPIGDAIKHELSTGKNDTTTTTTASSTTPAEPAASTQPPLPDNYCGPCYGAEEFPGQCCNTCSEVRNAYRNRGWALGDLDAIEQCVAAGETSTSMKAEIMASHGCRLSGYLEVNKVAGNFHFAPGKSFQHAHMHVHDLAAFQGTPFNMSHRVNRLSFGEEFPGIVNPLDDVEVSYQEDGNNMHMYYVKVVPTSYNYLNGTSLSTNQFSVTEHVRPISHTHNDQGGLPGIFFFYELSPLMVKYTQTRNSLAHFLTQLCAILGGVFTVAGMLDRLVHHTMRKLEHKYRVGKLG